MVKFNVGSWLSCIMFIIRLSSAAAPRSDRVLLYSCSGEITTYLASRSLTSPAAAKKILLSSFNVSFCDEFKCLTFSLATPHGLTAWLCRTVQ